MSTNTKPRMGRLFVGLLSSILIVSLFATSSMAQRKGIMYYCGLEGDRCGTNAEIEGGSLTNVSSPVRFGKGALRVNCSGVRAELKGNGAGGPNKPEWKERWFAVSVYIPNEFKGNKGGSAMFLQIHERPDSCENWRSPPLNFSMRGEEMWITVKWDPDACSKGGGVPSGGGEKQIWKDAASKYKGRWSDWVIHTIWSYKDDGLTEAWVDGKKVVTYRGPNAYNDSKEYYWKSGMYKRFSGSTMHYMDELRMGNENATYEDMAPGNPGQPTEPPTDPSTSATVSLQAGWNIVSLPVQPSNTSIGSVLGAINGKYQAVYSFDGSNYQQYVPGDSSNNLTTMEAGRGYWVYMDEAASFTVSGSAASKSVRLSEGWNLVGYNSTSESSVTQAFASIAGKYEAVYGFNASSNSYSEHIPGTTEKPANELTTLRPGQGYWVYATSGTDWSLP
jgi:hypothetical protein